VNEIQFAGLVILIASILVLAADIARTLGGGRRG